MSEPPRFLKSLKYVRRWHFWACFEREDRGKEEAKDEIEFLQGEGFKAKIWAPLPQHKTSGHIHVVVLCKLDELLKLAGVK